jgi:hypothetical protein
MDYQCARAQKSFLSGSEASNQKNERKWIYRKIYDTLPYTVAKMVDKIYSMVDIDIHPHNPYLPEKIVTYLETTN